MTGLLIICILVLLGVVGVLIALFAMHQDRKHKLEREHADTLQQFSTLRAQYDLFEKRFRPVLNLDQEALRVRGEIAALQAQHQAFLAQYGAQRNALITDYESSRQVHEQLRNEVARLEDSLEEVSVGLYRPHYSFDAAETYKARLEMIRDSKKQMVRENVAARCLVEWTVQGSRKEGERMQKQLGKLMLRAFNGECDAALANVDWKNITKMEARLQKAFESVNQLGSVVQVSIDQRYLELSIQELRLAFEYAAKKQAEQEEQRRIKEQMREEERAQRELQRAQDDTAAEERRYEKALVKATQEIGRAKGQELVALNEQIAALQLQLAEAHARHERAVSMAQLTRCGYIYVISNIGSFGDRVFKIGMTRRLDPMDRIWELGDASVPFDFDVHAMIYAEDAPTLERELHKYFDLRRVNMVNCKKEFFAVTVQEIQGFLTARGIKIELTMLAEAREYRQTLEMRKQPNLESDCPAQEYAAQVA